MLVLHHSQFFILIGLDELSAAALGYPIICMVYGVLQNQILNCNSIEASQKMVVTPTLRETATHNNVLPQSQTFNQN
jgi:hypothetical protein